MLKYQLQPSMSGHYDSNEQHYFVCSWKREFVSHLLYVCFLQVQFVTL